MLGVTARAHVAALDAVAVVAQPFHQPANAAAVRRAFQPRSRVGADQANPGTEGATTWKRVAAVGRVGEQRDGVEELVERPGPAVDEHEGQRIGTR